MASLDEGVINFYMTMRMEIYKQTKKILFPVFSYFLNILNFISFFQTKVYYVLIREVLFILLAPGFLFQDPVLQNYEFCFDAE